MKWITSLKNLLDKNGFNYTQSVLNKLIDDITYNFFFLTNIDLNRSNGKIYFGSNPSADKIFIENGVLKICSRITIILSSNPICINIQKKDGEFKAEEYELLDASNIFTYLDEIDPQTVYSKYVDQSYIPKIDIDTNFKIVIDSLFYESVYFEFFLNLSMNEMLLILKLIEVIESYNGKGRIHNHTIIFVKNRYVQYYIDFGSTCKLGLEYVIESIAELNYVEELRISSYPREELYSETSCE